MSLKCVQLVIKNISDGQKNMFWGVFKLLIPSFVWMFESMFQKKGRKKTSDL